MQIFRNKLTYGIAMTIDSAGHLFVLNLNDKTKQVSIVEYAPPSIKVRHVFDGSQFANASDLIAGPDGYLYVAIGSSQPAILVLDPATGSIVRTITDGVEDAVSLAFDASGNFYVASSTGSNEGIVSVYAPGATSPSYQIEQNDMYAKALLFDSKNDLYVVSPAGIFEFAPGNSTPKRTIGQGIGNPWGAAFGP
jgi:DNA-binding beta-propeller fold protein YncE